MNNKTNYADREGTGMIFIKSSLKTHILKESSVMNARENGEFHSYNNVKREQERTLVQRLRFVMVCFADEKEKDPGLVERFQRQMSKRGIYCACSSNIDGVYYLASCPKNWGVCWVGFAGIGACCSPEG